MGESVSGPPYSPFSTNLEDIQDDTFAMQDENEPIDDYQSDREMEQGTVAHNEEVTSSFQ